MADNRARRQRASDEQVPDELILAAAERAERHHPRPGAPATLATILEHLALARRSAAGRSVRVALERLADDGLLRRASVHGVAVWELTAQGRARVDRHALAALPDSPQLRAWRTAHTTAAQEIDRFGDEVASALSQAEALLARPACSSDEWFALAGHLRRVCWRMGSAVHCLREWPQPDDAVADVDRLLDGSEMAMPEDERVRLRALRAGRRNIRLWRE